MTKIFRCFIFAGIFGTLAFVGWACSKQNSNASLATSESESQSNFDAKVFFTENIKLGNDFYESQLIKNGSGAQTSYWQFVKTRNPSRGTLVYSLPYTGADWTGEEVDLRWSSHSAADVGFMEEDTDGPSFNSKTSKPIFYQLFKKDKLPITGLSFSLNDYNVLYVYHRFYAGRHVNHYVDDFVEAVKWVKSQNSSDEIGLLGLSLGGFIVSQAAQKLPSENVKALLLISPLLSWPMQTQYLARLNTLIPDPSKRSEYLDFFEPYERRFSNSDSSHLSMAVLKIPALLIHDEWDTLVPIEQADELEKTSQTFLTYVKHLHNNPIDYSTMLKDHQQPSEGQNSENILPFYLSYFFNRVGASTQNKYVVYTQASMDKLFSEMRTQSQAGRDVSGFQKGLREMCRPAFTFWESNQANVSESGPAYLTRKLNTVWGLAESEATICHFLETSKL